MPGPQELGPETGGPGDRARPTSAAAAAASALSPGALAVAGAGDAEQAAAKTAAAAAATTAPAIPTEAEAAAPATTAPQRRLRAFLAALLTACRRQWFLLALLAAIALAAAAPRLGATGGWLRAEHSVRVPAIVLVFLISGSGLKTSVLARAAGSLQAHALVQGVSLGVTPLVGWAVGTALRRSGALPRPLADGVVVMSCMPTTISTNVVYTDLVSVLHVVRAEFLGGGSRGGGVSWGPRGAPAGAPPPPPPPTTTTTTEINDGRTTHTHTHTHLHTTTKQAGGNESIALVNAVLGNLLGIFISPAWIVSLVPAAAADARAEATPAEVAADARSAVPYASVLGELGYLVLAPLVAGQLLQYFAPRAVACVRSKVALADVSSACIVLIVWVSFCNTFSAARAGKGTPTTAADGAAVLFLCAALLAAYTAIAFVASRVPVPRFERPSASRAEEKDRRRRLKEEAAAAVAAAAAGEHKAGDGALAAAAAAAEEEEEEGRALPAAGRRPCNGSADADALATTTETAAPSSPPDARPPPRPARSCACRPLKRADAVAVVICGATKTLALGAPLISVIYARSDDVGLVALPLVMYHALQCVVGAPLLPPLRRWRDGEPKGWGGWWSGALGGGGGSGGGGGCVASGCWRGRGRAGGGGGGEEGASAIAAAADGAPALPR